MCPCFTVLIATLLGIWWSFLTSCRGSAAECEQHHVLTRAGPVFRAAGFCFSLWFWSLPVITWLCCGLRIFESVSEGVIDEMNRKGVSFIVSKYSLLLSQFLLALLYQQFFKVAWLYLLALRHDCSCAPRLSLPFCRPQTGGLWARQI
eukprot:m.215569 g.215569  ORF g.215569 m.215569 type:complete len:148 (+) comp10778_c0_seq10:1078-1521(+)